MESHSRRLRSQLRDAAGESQRRNTPIQKPLCRLCECPTSDGHVLASQVDRFKLRKWAMEVMNLTEEDENLPEVVEEDALICYFCIWQAKFGDESGDEAVAWWPKNLDLEENAKALRENYSVGEVEQCWVQLEEVDLAKYEKKIPLKSKQGQELCLYCGKSFNHLLDHVRVYHKEAIKCGIRGCTTFFHTEEEKEQHMQQDFHKKQNKPCESRKIRCKYCEIGKLHSSVHSWRKHMKRNHPELPVACTRYLSCQEYFTSKSEMILHINSWHKQGNNGDLYQCNHCEYFTTTKRNLKRHKEARHMPKKFKCDSCDAKFGSKCLIVSHYQKCHRFENCKSCGQNLTRIQMECHRKPSVCSTCKVSFKCSGLYQLHRKTCKQTLFSCKECGKTFTQHSRLNIHVRRVHAKTVIFRCDHCDYTAFDKFFMKRHIQRRHFPKTKKCGECNQLFASEYFLKDHKSKVHSFVRCAECEKELSRRNMLRHRTAKTCRFCQCKLNCSGLLEKHMKSCRNNNFHCDKCPRIYGTKRSLYSHIVQMHIEK